MILIRRMGRSCFLSHCMCDCFKNPYNFFEYFNVKCIINDKDEKNMHIFF